MTLGQLIATLVVSSILYVPFFKNNISIIKRTKIKINDNHEDGKETIALNDFVYYNAEGGTVATGSSSTDITIQSNEAPTPVVKGLKSLEVTGGTLAPIFNSEQTGYTVSLDSATTNTFSIQATPNNSGDSIAYVNADNNETLNASNITFVTSTGKEEMAINVVVGSGENAVTYKLSIVKPVPSYATGELSSLTIGNKNVNLTTKVYDYEVKLSNVDSYQINATLKDSTNYKIENLPIPTEMSGEREFAIVIVPKDSSSGLPSYTYKISVVSDDTNSSNNTTNYSESINSNPQTGNKTTIIVVAIVLISSLILSLSLYKNNIKNFM